MSYPRYRQRGPIVTESESIGTETTMNFPYCSYVNPITRYRPSGRILLEESCSDFVNQGPPYREGHEFFLKRITCDYDDSDVVSNKYGFYGYDGMFTMNFDPSELWAVFNGYSPTAESYGAEAFKKCRPTKPGANLGQWIAELRDFPDMFRDNFRRFKDAGSNYLNLQFGWKPFLRDLRDFVKLQKTLENRIAFIRKNNGKWLKRRTTLRNKVDISTSQIPAMQTPIMVSQMYSSYPTRNPCYKTVTITDRIWFIGVMKYYIPGLKVDKTESIWTSPLLRKLWGLELTPSLVWELIPFTWLQDWCLNIGDILENFSNQLYDNLVIKYAYVMRHRATKFGLTEFQQLLKREPICSGGTITKWAPTELGPAISTSVIAKAECKERAKASQWGFGQLDSGPLTDRQLLILLALGITRV